MAYSLSLLIYAAEFHKDLLLDLCYLCLNDMPQAADCDLFLYADDIYMFVIST